MDKARRRASLRRKQAISYVVTMYYEECCDVSEHTLRVSSLYVEEASEKGMLKQRPVRLIRIM